MIYFKGHNSTLAREEEKFNGRRITRTDVVAFPLTICGAVFSVSIVIVVEIILRCIMSGRRRLLDNRSSYERTGLSCGNPKRYESQETVCMDGSRGRGGGKAVGPGEEEMETEGQRQLQALLKKQLNTKISLAQQLSQRREFTRSEARVSVTAGLRGVSDLWQYQTAVNTDDRTEELLQAGLSPAQVQLKLSAQDDSPTSKSKKPRLGMDPSVQGAQLEEIDAAIRRREEQLQQPDIFAGRRHVSRHKLDLEKSLVQGDPASKSLSGLLLKQEDYSTPDARNPINHLPAILQEVEQRATQVSSARTCQTRCHDEKDSSSVACSAVVDGIGGISETCTGSTADTRLGSEEKSAGDSCGEDCRHSDVGADVCGPPEAPPRVGPKVLTQPVTFVPEDVIEKYRLSAEEVKKLPRFENYTAGVPNKILYLKNLAAKVTELDLVSLFGRFQEAGGEKIQYRLMTGRMRGQAFVTFDSEQTASCALKLLHGYHFKGKPVIIQYGRQSQGTSTSVDSQLQRGTGLNLV